MHVEVSVVLAAVAIGLWAILARRFGRCAVEWTGDVDSSLWRPFMARAREAPWREYVEAPWVSALLSIFLRTGSGHFHTIYASYLHDYISHPGIEYRRETLVQADGGNVTVDWVDRPHHAPTTPTVLMLHGLSGGSQEAYIKSAITEFEKRGWRCVVFNARGCAGSQLTTAQLYSASFTKDLDNVAAYLCKVIPNAPICAVGYSLGANILVNYLGEKGRSAPFVACASICNPFDLSTCSSSMHHSWFLNTVYGRALAASLKRTFSRHRASLERLERRDVDLAYVFGAATLRQLDERFTRRAFGYRSVDDYYRDSSSSSRLRGVGVPLLCLSALDDPISVGDAVPFDEFRLNPLLMLGTTAFGGHVSWHCGPIAADAWADRPLADYFAEMFAMNASGALKKAIEETGAVPIKVPAPLANNIGDKTLTAEMAAARARQAKLDDLPIKSLGEHPFSRLSHATMLLLIFIAVSAVSHAVVINKLLTERMAAE